MSKAGMELDEYIEGIKDVRELKRALSIKISRNGYKGTEIKKMLNVSEQYVSKWNKKYEEGGVEALRLGYEGRERYLSTEEKKEVLSWIGKQKHLQVTKLEEHIAEKYGVVYSSQTSYYELLKEGGMSYHRSGKVNPKRNEEQVLKKREEIKKELAEKQPKIENEELVVLMEDECHLLYGDVCGQVWAERGARVEVEMSNEKQRQTYYGAINVHSGQFHLSPFSSGNGANTVEYVKALQTLYPESQLLFIWDGASYHKYAEMRDYLAELNEGIDEQDWPVTCLLFAPNAPDQNPVEDIWLKGKNFLRRNFSKFKTFSQVKQAFSHFLSNLDIDLNSTKFNWYCPSWNFT
jgi:transposase